MQSTRKEHMKTVEAIEKAKVNLDIIKKVLSEVGDDARREMGEDKYRDSVLSNHDYMLSIVNAGGAVTYSNKSGYLNVEIVFNKKENI